MELCFLKSVVLEKLVVNNFLWVKYFVDEDVKFVVGFGFWGFKLKNFYVLVLFCDGKNYLSSFFFDWEDCFLKWENENRYFWFLS